MDTTLWTIQLGSLPAGEGLRLRLRGLYHPARSVQADVFLLKEGSYPVRFDPNDESFVGVMAIYGHDELAAQPQDVRGGLALFDVLLDARSPVASLGPGTAAWVVIAPRRTNGDLPGPGDLWIDGADLELHPSGPALQGQV